MSSNTYTITVILKAFFADCRAQAKIFISENIKTILDLENKISRIFGIKEFHLLSNEKLLPSCEDVRLLENGDIVCVLPNESQPNLLLLPERFYSTNSETLECKKKKRHSLVDECPLKEKKCKKKRKETASSSDEKSHELYEHKLTKTTKKLSNRKKSKDGTNINNILQPGHNECVVSTSTPNTIDNNICDDFNIKYKQNIVLVDEEKQDCEQVEKVRNKKCRTGNEHSSKKHSKKPKKNQLSSKNTESLPELKIIEQKIFKNATENVEKETSSNKFLECEYVHPITFAESPTKNNLTHNNSNKIKETTNSKLEAPANDSFLKMIVDDSSSSGGNDTVEEISNNLESNIVKDFTTNTCNPEIEKKKKTLKYSSNEPKQSNQDDSVTTQRKTFSLYSLPAKKKNWKSWSTSPLLNKTNHVKINRVPIVSSTDLSRFVFKDSDVGAVPVPNTSEESLKNSNFISYQNTSNPESVGTDIRNDIIRSSLTEPLINISQCSSISLLPKNNSSIAEVSLSDCDIGKTKTLTLSKKETCTENQNIKEFYQSLYSNHSMASTPIQTNMENSENVVPPSTDEVNTASDWSNFNETEINKDIVRKNWRQNVLGKLSDNKQISLQNQKKTCTVVNETMAVNNAESEEHSFGVSAKLVKLNTNSGRIKKRNMLNKIGVNYYLKLLNKIDWDVTRSVSDISVEETNCISENTELNKVRKPTEIVKDKEEALDNLDLSSVSSTISNFVTKRKRKRKHRKKVRVDTPVPRKIINALPSKNFSLVKGNPKVHIRFQSEENGYPFEDDNAQTKEASVIFDKSNEKVKILQNLSLDLSKQNEENIPSVESIPTETENGENIPSTVISTCSNMSQGIIEEQTSGNFSIQRDNKIEMKSSPQCTTISSESHNDNEKKDSNENTMLNRTFPTNTTKNSCQKKINESGGQGIALDYTSENLTSNENNRCILNSSCIESKLSKTFENEALDQAKVALLKAVGFVPADGFSDTIRSVDSNDSCTDLSIVNITDISI